MNILGITLGHDTSFALVVDGEVCAIIEVERYFRQKRYKLHCHELKPGKRISGFQEVDVDELRHTLEMVRAAWGGVFDAVAIQNQGRREEFQNCLQLLRESGFDFKETFHLDHHLCHAALGFFTSPFEEALILSYDGEGNDGFTILFHGTPQGIEYKERNPVKYGHAYNNLGYLMGVSPDVAGSTAGKTMGLSAYGEEIGAWREPLRRHLRDFYRLPPLSVTGVANYGKAHQAHSLYLNNILEFGPYLRMRGRPESLSPVDWWKYFWKPDNKKRYIRLPGVEHPLSQNLANTFQKVWSEEVVELVRLHSRISKKLCVVGGCALNGTTNFNIQQAGLFDKHHFIPNPTDCGLSAGAALLAFYRLSRKPFHGYGRYYTPYLGMEPFDIDQMPKYRSERGHIQLSPEKAAAVVARLVGDNYIVGVIRGRYEVGPRALGNRSILANPLHPDMRTILNEKVKHREWYRPFAPVALAEEASKYFDLVDDIPYMSVICHTRPEFRAQLPSITHVDGSVRLQTVREEQNDFLRGVLKEFKRLTGFPILLNTSFNPGGEPILNYCHVGLSMLDKTKMDFVLIENTLFYRPEHEKLTQSELGK